PATPASAASTCSSRPSSSGDRAWSSPARRRSRSWRSSPAVRWPAAPEAEWGGTERGGGVAGGRRRGGGRGGELDPTAVVVVVGESYSNRPTSIGSSAAVGGSTSECPLVLKLQFGNARCANRIGRVDVFSPRQCPNGCRSFVVLARSGGQASARTCENRLES